MDELTTPAARDWWERGRWVDLPQGRVFTVDVAGDPGTQLDPVLVLHGFPSSSFDWRHVVGTLAAGGRRVVLFDFIGFGLSDKPDGRYGIGLHADTTEALADTLGLGRVVLVTHDMGDSVGGELLARGLDGTCRLDVVRRVLSNGSIYLGLAQLTDGQKLLLSIDDARVDGGVLRADDGASFKRGLAQVFSSGHQPSDGELEAQWELMDLADGSSLLPRLIRYLEDRQVNEARYTGAIETHPAPLTVVWGELDPVSRVEMVEQLSGRRPDAEVVILHGIGHYPMIEAPERFAAAVAAGLG